MLGIKSLVLNTDVSKFDVRRLEIGELTKSGT